MPSQRERVGFTDSRANVLSALRRMGIACCSYSHGGIWADRCDCKYGVTEVKAWPAVSERGNGCPELRSLHGVIQAMDDDEWARLVARAGGSPRGAVLEGDDICQKLHRAQAAAAMADHHIGEVRKALNAD
jgi:hypothetical protein